jgi:hypothetical protein
MVKAHRLRQMTASQDARMQASLAADASHRRDLSDGADLMNVHWVLF